MWVGGCARGWEGCRRGILDACGSCIRMLTSPFLTALCLIAGTQNARVWAGCRLGAVGRHAQAPLGGTALTSCRQALSALAHTLLKASCCRGSSPSVSTLAAMGCTESTYTRYTCLQRGHAWGTQLKDVVQTWSEFMRSVLCCAVLWGCSAATPACPHSLLAPQQRRCPVSSSYEPQEQRCRRRQAG